MRSLFSGPGWPLAALFVLYPLWWALGFAAFAWIVFSVPMVVMLARRRPLKTPPWFGVWLAFLGVVAFGVLMVGVNAPNTLPLTSVANGYVVWGLRLMHYLSVTVVLLYAGNLTEKELPNLRLVKMLGVLFAVTVVGGVLGMLVPSVSYASPVELVLTSGPVDAIVPGTSLASNEFVRQLTHVSVAQSQELLGAPRPSAPFEFTNAWGNNFAVLLGWFLLAFVLMGSRRMRVAAFALLAVSVVPAIYSQNRGMWLGLALAVVYLVLRMTLLGRYRLVLGALVVTATLGVLVLAVPPLSSVVTGRIDTPHSNDIRASLARQSINAALNSPVVGYGTTRTTIGSERSATIGATVDCPKCGNRVIGSTGQFWLMLVSHGLLGTALYFVFLGQAVVRYWRNHTWLGIVGVQALVLTLFFAMFYSALVTPLAVAMLSFALLWRSSENSPAAP